MRSFLHRALTRGRRSLAVTLAAVLALGALGLAAPGVTAAPANPCPAAVPVSQIKAGMTGSGLTVSQGTAPQPFTVKVIGLLNDGIAPGLDMIIVETDSPALTAAGGIWAGMSGSPVYAADGRIIGAVAYGLDGPSKIGGLTPAEEMLKVLAFPPAAGQAKQPARVALPKALQDAITRTGAATAAEASGGMRRLKLPLGISGLNQQHFDKITTVLSKSRLNAVPYRASAAPAAPASPAEIVPGGNFAAALSYGDVTLAGVGTTTVVCNGTALAFGHPLTFSGKTTLSAHPADALFVQPDPLFGPFKVANPGGVAGTLDQDRLAAIRAKLGAGPVPIPVDATVSAAGTGLTRTGTTRVNRDEDLPGLAATHLLADMDRVVQKIGEGTSVVTWTVTGRRADGRTFTYTRGNRFASQFDISFESIFEMVDKLSILQVQPFEDIRFTSVKASASATEQYRQYRIDKVLQKVGPNRYVAVGASRPVRGRAGGVIQIRILLASFKNRTPGVTLDVAYKVPADKRGSFGSLDVVGGLSSFDDSLSCIFDPTACADNGGVHNVDQILAKLRAQLRNDQLTATLTLEPAPGRPNRRSVTKATRNLSLVVAGRRSIPVVIAA